MTRQIIFYLELAALLALPILLFALYPGLFAARYAFTVVGSLYCIGRLYIRHTSIRDLGITFTSFWPSLRELILPSLLMIVSTFLIFALLPGDILRIIVGYDPLPVTSLSERVLIYFFISTPLQELIFRSYLTKRLEDVFASMHSIQTASIIIFTLAHIPFFSPLILLLSFVMGFVYIRNYLRYRNVLPLIISHSVVGSAIILIKHYLFLS